MVPENKRKFIVFSFRPIESVVFLNIKYVLFLYLLTPLLLKCISFTYQFFFLVQIHFNRVCWIHYESPYCIGTFFLSPFYPFPWALTLFFSLVPLHKICVWTQIRKIKRKLIFNQSESRIKDLRLIFLICVQTQTQRGHCHIPFQCCLVSPFYLSTFCLFFLLVMLNEMKWNENIPSKTI